MRYKRVPKPYCLDLTTERISAGKREISSSLRTERREWARKRLTGVRSLLSGLPLKSAARRLGVKPETLSGWFRVWRDSGCIALLANPPAYEPKLPVMDARELTRMKLAVTALLEGAPKPDARSQQRLRALVIALLSNIDDAASIAYVRAASVRRWLRTAHEKGPAAILEKRHPGRPGPRT